MRLRTGLGRVVWSMLVAGCFWGASVGRAQEPTPSGADQPAAPTVKTADDTPSEKPASESPKKDESPKSDEPAADEPTPEKKSDDEPAAPDQQESPKSTSDSSKNGELSSQLRAASKRLAGEQTFQLEYRAAKGETIRWKVVHLVTVDTKIRGSEQTAKTRSVSVKSWKVSNVDADGNITLVHTVESADMWQNVSGRQEIRYNSKTDAVPPREYEQVAKSIGVPLATITFNRHGKILKRDSAVPQFNAGLGELTIPLPEQPVKIGAKWQVPDELNLRLEDGRVQRVKTRQLYSLDKVETGVATIGIRTEVLTPVNDPKIHSQLVQRLTNGSVKFDLEAGRLISKQLDLDETVVGFSGGDSVMQYLARFTEDYQPNESKPAGSTARVGPAAGKTDSEKR